MGYNLQGIIRRNVINSNTQFERLGYVSSNFANYTTNGYKSVRFETLLDPNGYLDGVVRSDHSVGSIVRTENKLDVAIDGIGYIPVTSENGEVTYTRDGSFKINNAGYLVTNDGYLVGEGIKIPPNHDHLRISDSGEIYVYDIANPEQSKIGKIPLVSFLNTEGLKSVGYNKYAATEDSGEALLVKDHKRFRQGFIEQSNTNVFSGVNDMLRLNAAVISSMNVMKLADQLYQKAISLRS